MSARCVYLLGLGIAVATWLRAGPAFAQSCPEGTGVLLQPLGHGISLDLAPGTSSVFTVGTSRVTCRGSRTSCTIPTTGNPGDPVVAVLSPPSCGTCTSSSGATASSTTNNNNGDWLIGFSCGGKTTIRIPRAGIVSRTGSCTITVAPNGPVSVPASFANGSPSRLTINSASLPIAKSGFGCPSSSTSTATFSAVFLVTDATDASQNVTLTEVSSTQPEAKGARARR